MHWQITGDSLTPVRLYREAPLGQFVPVKIDGAMTYDLTGQVELQQGRVITLSA